MTVMGDALMNRLSDRGSIPLRSIVKSSILSGFFLLRKFQQLKFAKLVLSLWTSGKKCVKIKHVFSNIG